MRDRVPMTYDGLTAAGRRRPSLRLLLLVLAALILLVVAVLVFRPAAQTAVIPAPAGPVTPAASPDGTTSPSPTASSASAGPVLSGNDDQDIDPAKVTAAVVPVVERFTDAWLLNEPAAKRRAALTPVATARLTAALANTDPGRLPAAVRLGEPSVVAAGTYHTRCEQRLSDDSAIMIDLVPDPQATGRTRWLVTAVRPSEG